MRLRTVSAALVLLALSAACGSPAEKTTAASKSQPEEQMPVARQRDDNCQLLAGTGPRIFAVDNAFGPDCITVRSDAALYVTNFGTYKHSLTISEGDLGTKPFVADVELPGGKTKPRAVTLADVLEPGSYEFFCKYHGGMNGVMDVIAPNA